MTNENQTITYTIKTAATTNREITVEVDYYFDFVELLDKEPAGIDKTFELLDVSVNTGYNSFVEKLYKVPANEIFECGFCVLYYYDFNTHEEQILFPTDFEASAVIKDFDDLKFNYSSLNWYTINELTFDSSIN